MMARFLSVRVGLVIGMIIFSAVVAVVISVSNLQRADAAPSVLASEVKSMMTLNNIVGDSIFGVPDVVTVPHPHVEKTQTLASLDTDYAQPRAPKLGTVQAMPLGDCKTTLTAAPVAGAFADLTVDAPCHSNEFFVVEHRGVMFSGKTDADGLALVRAPALTREARFAVLFDNIQTATTVVTINDIDQFDRAVLQWQGADNLQLHALKTGAKIGDPGHIWSASGTSPTDERGSMSRLGTTAADFPHMVEIHTIPVDSVARSNGISLQVGVVVMDINCSRTVRAEVIQIREGVQLNQREIRLSIPGCDAVGRSMLLPNMFENLELSIR